MPVRRRSFAAVVGSALLAAIVLCPLMATAAPAATAAGCHERPAQNHHGDGSPAFTCCATVVAAASVKATPEADAALAPAVELEPHRAHHTLPQVEHAPPRSASPPLFVRHAALLI